MLYSVSWENRQTSFRRPRQRCSPRPKLLISYIPSPERRVPSRCSLRSRGEDAKLGDAGPVPRYPGISGLAFSSGSMRLRGGVGCWMAPQRLSLCLTPRSLPERWAGVTRQRHRQRVKSLSCLFQTRWKFLPAFAVVTVTSPQRGPAYACAKTGGEACVPRHGPSHRGEEKGRNSVLPQSTPRLIKS